MALTKEREQEIRDTLHYAITNLSLGINMNIIQDVQELLQEIDELRETAGEISADIQETLKVKRSLFNAKVEAENERDLCRTQLWDAHDKLKAERDNYKGLYEMREKDFRDQCKMLDLNHKGHTELRDKLKEENQQLKLRAEEIDRMAAQYWKTLHAENQKLRERIGKMTEALLEIREEPNQLECGIEVIDELVEDLGISAWNIADRALAQDSEAEGKG